jgi:hypothetical protein
MGEAVDRGVEQLGGDLIVKPMLLVANVDHKRPLLMLAGLEGDSNNQLMGEVEDLFRSLEEGDLIIGANQLAKKVPDEKTWNLAVKQAAGKSRKNFFDTVGDVRTRILFSGGKLSDIDLAKLRGLVDIADVSASKIYKGRQLVRVKPELTRIVKG